MKIKSTRQNILHSPQRGVALLEVLIAIVVFAIGVLGLSALQMRTLGIALDSTQRTTVVAKSQDIADRMRTNLAAITDYRGTYSQRFCDVVPAVSCSDGSDSGAGQCTGTQMASHDLWDVFCSPATAMENSVIEWQTVISCTDTSGACAVANAEVDVTTTWVLRSNDNDERVRGRTITTGGDGFGGSETQTDASTDRMTLRFVP